jgi:methionyl-tRNA formyltransferase
MKIAYAGTPEFARVALAALVDAGHEVVLVLTQPDRPAGRGLKLQLSPVKQYAQARGLPLAQPKSLRLDGKHPQDAAAAQAALQSAAPEVMVVAAYGLILPAWTLALPRHGCLNIHGSLLPRWRGAAPIQRAIEAGDTRTGITLMQMDAGLDTGDMCLSLALDIDPEDSSATLFERLAVAGAELVVQGLADLQAGRLPRQPQPAEGVSYAHKIDKTEAAVDWTRPAAEIERRLRAFDPFPGASAVVEGQALKLWRGRVVSANAMSAKAVPAPLLPAHALPTPAAPAQKIPGTRLDMGEGRLVLACGEGALELLQVQPAGGRRMAAADWLRGLDAARR